MTTMAKRGIFIGLLLLIVSGATIYFTIDLDSISTLGTFNLTSLALAGLALVMGMYFDGLRLQRLVRMGGYTLPLVAILRVIFGNYFMAMLTPGASGGAVAQALILRSYQVPIGKAAPIVLVRTVFSILFLIVMLPIILLTDPIEIPYITNTQLLWASVFVVISTFMGMYLLQTRLMKHLVAWLSKVTKKGNAKAWLLKLDEFNSGLSLLYANPIQSLIVFVESGLSLLCLYAIAPALMYAFTTDISIVEILNRMILLNLILYFAPTPGGTGVAEGLFVYLFAAFLPVGTVGLVEVAWRIVAEYIPFFVGMYSVFTLYGQHIASSVSTSSEEV